MSQESIKIFFFGDSICFGQGVSIHKGWVSKIAHKLDELSSNLNNRQFLLSNNSINGNTTRLALERMPYEVQSHRPEIVLTQFGMNDCNYWETDNGCPRVSLDSFKANMMEIVTRAFLNGSKIVIINTNHPTLKHNQMKNTSITYEDSNQFYNQAIRDVFKKIESTYLGKVFLNDVEAKFREEIIHTPLSNLVLPDCLHLSERGHAIYFDTVFPTILRSIELLCRESK